MTLVLACFILVFVLGLGAGRKTRKRSFDIQRHLGDAIALRNGTYPKRLVRKQVHKRTNGAIGKLKFWRKK